MTVEQVPAEDATLILQVPNQHITLQITFYFRAMILHLTHQHISNDLSIGGGAIEHMCTFKTCNHILYLSLWKLQLKTILPLSIESNLEQPKKPMTIGTGQCSEIRDQATVGGSGCGGLGSHCCRQPI